MAQKKLTVSLAADKQSYATGLKDPVFLNVGDMIDYKPAAELRVTTGKIIGFKYAGYNQSDKSSVWMNLKEAEVNGSSEWISLENWLRYHEAGLFNAITPVEDGNKKPIDKKKRPF